MADCPFVWLTDDASIWSTDDTSIWLTDDASIWPIEDASTRIESLLTGQLRPLRPAEVVDAPLVVFQPEFVFEFHTVAVQVLRELEYDAIA